MDNIFNVKGKVALVTGSTGALGFSFALGLARHGATVILNSRKKDKQDQKVQELKNEGHMAFGYVFDVTSSAQVNDAVQKIEKEVGPIDILVNNAGIAPAKRTDILEAGEESFDKVMSVNLKGPYFLTQLMANWMIEQKKQYPQRRFRIINIGSMSAYTSSPFRGEYCISKAGMGMMTKLSDKCTGV